MSPSSPVAKENDAMLKCLVDWEDPPDLPSLTTGLRPEGWSLPGGSCWQASEASDSPAHQEAARPSSPQWSRHHCHRSPVWENMTDYIVSIDTNIPGNHWLHKSVLKRQSCETIWGYLLFEYGDVALVDLSVSSLTGLAPSERGRIVTPPPSMSLHWGSTACPRPPAAPVAVHLLCNSTHRNHIPVRTQPNLSQAVSVQHQITVRCRDSLWAATTWTKQNCICK